MEQIVQLKIDTIVAVCSAIAAFASALYAYRSKRIAEKALAIAETELELKKDSLAFYLVNGFKYTQTNSNVVLAFHATITNRSLTANAIERAELLITFFRKDGSVGTMVIPHDSALCDDLGKTYLTPFNLPCAVPPKTALSQWGLFALPKDMFSQFRIDKYTFRVTDIGGNVESVDSYIVKEDCNV